MPVRAELTIVTSKLERKKPIKSLLIVSFRHLTPDGALVSTYPVVVSTSLHPVG